MKKLIVMFVLLSACGGGEPRLVDSPSDSIQSDGADGGDVFLVKPPDGIVVITPPVISNVVDSGQTAVADAGRQLVVDSGSAVSDAGCGDDDKDDQPHVHGKPHHQHGCNRK